MAYVQLHFHLNNPLFDPPSGFIAQAYPKKRVPPMPGNILHILPADRDVQLLNLSSAPDENQNKLGIVFKSPNS